MKASAEKEDTVEQFAQEVKHGASHKHQEHQISWEHLNPVKYIFFNAAFQSMNDVVLYPFDVVRTRQQAYVTGSKNVDGYFPRYKNTFHALWSIWKQEGIKGCYKGFLISEMACFSATLIHYTGYEILKGQFRHLFPETSNSIFSVFAISFASGAIADMFSMAFVIPAEVIQQRLQLQGSNMKEPKYKGTFNALQTIYNDQGLAGLYRGSGATILRNVPAAAMWWAVYEITKNFLHDHDPRRFLGLPSWKGKELKSGVENEDYLIQGLSGVAAALITGTIINPIEVAKTRLQTQDMTNAKVVTRFRHLHERFRLSSIWFDTKDGGRCLRAFLPALMTSTPSAVVSILIYEYAKKFSLVRPE